MMLINFLPPRSIKNSSVRTKQKNHDPHYVTDKSIRREPKRWKGRRADDLQFQDAVNDSIIAN